MTAVPSSPPERRWWLSGENASDQTGLLSWATHWWTTDPLSVSQRMMVESLEALATHLASGEMARACIMSSWPAAEETRQAKPGYVSGSRGVLRLTYLCLT